MGRSRLAAVAGLVALLSGLLAAPPTSASTWAPPSLAGVTTLRGSEAGSILVRLPKRINLTNAERSAVDPQPPEMMFGDGRLVGFVLAQQGVSGSKQAVYAGWRAGRCLERGCPRYRGGVEGIFSVRTSDVLPPGDYMLYLIADGADARVRLELPGLSGKRSFRAHPTDDIDLQTLQPNITETDRGTVFSGAATTDMRGDGFPLFVMWAEGRNEAVQGTAEQCGYDEPQQHDSLYIPGCPGADHATGRMSLAATSNYSSMWTEDLKLWAAMYGNYVIARGEAKSVGMVATWVKF